VAADLEARLERRFRTRETLVDLERRQVRILHPANADDLISEEDFIRDERMPYWADLWPSSLMLARSMVNEVGKGAPLLELGCGSGLVTVAAAIAGYDVLATDYYDDALLFTQVNAERNLVRQTVRTRDVDWRQMPEDLGRFPRVIAADVLYEPTYGDLIANAIAVTLAADGRATVADPGRLSRDNFIAAAKELGLNVDLSRKVKFAEGEVRQEITLIDLRWPIGHRRTSS
jgi:predicted nicotinamide N-methyase